MNLFPTLSVADKLALTLDGLARAVAARSARGPSWLGGLAPLAALLIRLVWTRVKRTETRILRLLARFQEGRLAVRSSARAAASAGRVRGGATKGVPQRAEGKVPRRFGWLLPLVPCEAANYASQLRLWLAEPEMVALLAASAQARRVLAPLCRMLGIDAAMLTPPGAEPAEARAADPEERRARGEWDDPPSDAKVSHEGAPRPVGRRRRRR